MYLVRGSEKKGERDGVSNTYYYVNNKNIAIHTFRRVWMVEGSSWYGTLKTDIGGVRKKKEKKKNYEGR